MDFSQVSYVGYRTAGVARWRYENDLRRVCKVKHERMPVQHPQGVTSSKPIDAPRA
jgi:hypothetical protein